MKWEIKNEINTSFFETNIQLEKFKIFENPENENSLKFQEILEIVSLKLGIFETFIKHCLF